MLLLMEKTLRGRLPWNKQRRTTDEKRRCQKPDTPPVTDGFFGNSLSYSSRNRNATPGL